jgi:DNA-binding CsgD family transcriptional regulator
VAAPLLESAVEGLRERGNPGTVAQALMSQAWVAAQLGQVRTGLAAASECRALGQELGFAMWAVAAQAAQAQLEALRGNSAQAVRLADESERVLLPAGAGPLLALVALARGVAALADGRPGDAWDQLSQIFDPAGLPFHPHVRGHALGLLAEAAVASGHRDELSAIVDDLQSLADACPSPVLLRTLAYARAVLAPAGDAEALFLHALGAGLDDWTFERARLQLAYGAWLRRHRRPAASRELLRSASMAFDALGVTPWADRARRELAASGASLRRRVDQRDALTPQELQIAQLAAQGLSNREIAERLFVSPRTVSTHLYRVYPKLGVTTRAELRRALDQ